MSQPSASPAEVYRRRKASCRDTVERLRRREQTLSWVRLALFVLAAALVWPTLFSGRLTWGWLALPVVAFVGVLSLHDHPARIPRLPTPKHRLVAGRWG